MLLQAMQVSFDCLADICRAFRARLALGNTTWESRTRGYENSVLVLLQIDTILHDALILTDAPPMARPRIDSTPEPEFEKVAYEPVIIQALATSCSKYIKLNQ